MHDDGYAVLRSLFAHLEADLPHAGEAHLRKEVEAVLADDDDPRPMLRKSAGEASVGIVDHGVEDCYRETSLAQQRRGVHGSERRVGLPACGLLAIVVQVIGVREEHFNRGRIVHQLWHLRAFCFPTVVLDAVSGGCHSFVISGRCAILFSQLGIGFG